MLAQVREMGKAAAQMGMAERLDDVEWGSQEMAAIVNLYIVGLCKSAGMSVLFRLSPLVDLGIDVNDGASSAAQLAAIQGLTADEFSDLIKDAWEQANSTKAPEAAVGYKHFGGEVIMEAVRRLGGRRA